MVKVALKVELEVFVNDGLASPQMAAIKEFLTEMENLIIDYDFDVKNISAKEIQ